MEKQARRREHLAVVRHKDGGGGAAALGLLAQKWDGKMWNGLLLEIGVKNA